MVNDVTLAHRVAERFIQASAPIVIKEVNDRIEVSGPYDRMKDLIPYLRGKFEYRGSDRTWWAPKAKMTPLKMKNLQKKIDEVNGKFGPAPVKVEEPAEEKADRLEEAKKLLNKALHLRVPGLSFSPIGIEGAQLTGALTDLRVLINMSGGDYGPEFSSFSAHEIKPVEFEKLLDAIEDQGKLVAKSLADLSNIIPRNFQNLKINVGTNNGSYLFIVSGKTYDFRNEIKKLVPVTFNGQRSFWWAPIHQVKEAQVKKLIEYLEGEERALAEKWKAEKVERTPTEKAKRPNRRGDHCLTCGAWVDAGDGYLVDHWDDDEDELVYKVVHSDPSICAEVKEEARIRHEKARTKQEAKRNLYKLCAKSEYYVQGTGHRPPGEQIWIDKTALGYGGGAWVVIEPGENYFWYVENNGADGDDWSRNNVTTGGAGAIGYRLPMTDEAKVLIEVAKE